MSKKPITIGICAPSSSFDRSKFEKSVEFLNSCGFKTVFPDAIFKKKGYFSGKDETRALVINSLFSDKEVDVIMCARGGYGSSRIINLLDVDLIRKNPKIFIGASDVCSLLFYLENNSTSRVFFGPFVTEMSGDMDKDSLELFLKMISGGESTHRISCLKALVPGKVIGKITGGCLSIIQSSLKTSYEIETDGKILFIEDVSEPLYKIDRMLTHLKNAGKFKKIKGVIAGAFTKSHFSTEKFDALIIDIFGEYDIPIITGFPAGHGDKKFIIPFDQKVVLDADKGFAEYIK